MTRASPTRSPIRPATSAATMYPPATAARIVRRRRERLVEADGDVEDDERARACEGPLPRRVRDEERRDVPVLAEDAPRVGDVRADAFEDASVTAVLRDEEDRDEARARRRPPDCDEERRRVPGVKEVPAADQRTADRDPSERRAGRPAHGRTRSRAARPGRARDRAARRRSRRRRARSASARSSRGSA